MSLKSIARILLPGLYKKYIIIREQKQTLEKLYNHIERNCFHKLYLIEVEKDVLSLIKKNYQLEDKIIIFDEKPGVEQIKSDDLVILGSRIDACIQENKMLEEGYLEKNIYRLRESEDKRCANLNVFDPLLGYTRTDEFNGFTTYGNINSPNRLLILGNSTSDVTQGNWTNWIEQLSLIFKENNIDCFVIGGGITANTSSQELLRLIRDGIHLKPTAVISYSGITDAYNEHFNDKNLFVLDYQVDVAKIISNLYSKEKSSRPRTLGRSAIDSYDYGIKNDLSRGENLVLNQRLMHSICLELDIPFLCFLQPYLGSSNEIDKYHQWITESMNQSELDATKNFYGYVRTRINDIPWAIDFSQRFKDIDGIYVDYVHMFERGNIMLAKEMYSELEKRIDWK